MCQFVLSEETTKNPALVKVDAIRSVNQYHEWSKANGIFKIFYFHWPYLAAFIAEILARSRELQLCGRELFAVISRLLHKDFVNRKDAFLGTIIQDVNSSFV